MQKINTEKHIKEMVDDFNTAIDELKKMYDENKDMQKIIDIAIGWHESNDCEVWSFFNKAFPTERPIDFYECLRSFLANCILDDSSYNIKWKKYVGGIKMWARGKAWKDDPYVVWAGDEGTNDPKLMLRAMKYVVQKEEARRKRFKEWEK